MVSRIEAGSGTVTIMNCWSTVDIIQQSSEPIFSGGLIGEILTGTVEMDNCYFSGSISGSGGSNVQQVGGLCGINSGTLTATNCYVSGIFATDPASTDSGENLAVGGGTFTATNCYYMEVINTASQQGTQVTLEDVESGKLAWLLNTNKDGTPCSASGQSGWAQGTCPGYTPGSGKPASIPVRSDGTNGVIRLISVDGATETTVYSSSAVTLPASGLKSWWYQAGTDGDITYVKVATDSVSEDSKVYLLGGLTADMVAVADVYYTGQQAAGNVTVTFDSAELTEGTDYTLTYVNATEIAERTAANPPTVTIQGMGSYTGTISKNFTIHKTEAIITIAEDNTSYEKAYGEEAFALSGITHTGDGTLAYTSSDTGIVTVDDTGRVTIVGGGEAVITVSMAETEKYSEAISKTITVMVKVPVTGISLEPTLTLKARGAVGTLTAAIAPENATNKNLTWTSDAPLVATVTEGVVTPLMQGSAMITVSTVDGGYSATCTVTVEASECPASYYGVQKRENTDNTTDLRLIAIIKTREVQEVGFVYSTSDTIPAISKEGCNSLSTTKVYSSIKVNNEAKTAVDLGGEDAYIIVGIVKNIVSITTDKLYVCVYVKKNEETTYSEVKELSVSTLQ